MDSDVLMDHNTEFQLMQVAEFSNHEERVWHLAWNPTRPLLASCSSDKSVNLYHYDTTGKFEQATSISTGHSKTVRAVAWAPSGKTLATASFDSQVGIWEQEEPEEEGGAPGEWECTILEGHENECKCVAYSSSGTLLATCSRDKTVWVWEVQPDSEFECVGVLMEHTQDVKCVAWHPTEEILASASYDDTIRLYVDDPDEDWYAFQVLSGHESTVWSLAFSPCGKYLASASDDLTIRLWRRAAQFKWEPIGMLRGHDRTIFSVSWGLGNGDGENAGWLASTGSDGKINVWEMKAPENGTLDSKLIATLRDAHSVSDVNCVAWNPRPGLGDLLATAGDDCSVRVWRITGVA
ncbi:WD40 repeat-like protein [Rickenella mellea]|uniref:Probable cytosolic iron-sulfur protein assembly protein 1 n=1 Tax=Rickenella mellea TaxID=50990 RepID=A0A4Y7PU95_9AGAM|nr:WD40 repeat-like protein [Rickenella mellea]